MNNNLKLGSSDREGYLKILSFKGLELKERLYETKRKYKLQYVKEYRNEYYKYKLVSQVWEDIIKLRISEKELIKDIKIIRNDYLGINEDMNEIGYKIFNKEVGKNLEENKKSLYLWSNIISNREKSFEIKNVSNKLVVPNYFFTNKYIEKSMPSQINHWKSSIYSFIKKDKSRINYLDMYVSIFLRRIFWLKLIKRKYILNKKLNYWGVIKLLDINNIWESINKLLKVTSKRYVWKKGKMRVNIPYNILSEKWLKSEINMSDYFRKVLFTYRKTKLGDYFPKKLSTIFKRDKIYVGYPYFRHTPYNIIIDLFIYYNKKGLTGKLQDVIKRRTLYRYMYSMYSNNLKKIQETLNKPSYYFINIIEPKLFIYYVNVINTYQHMLINKNKNLIVNISLFILKWNIIIKRNKSYIKNVLFSFKENSRESLMNIFAINNINNFNKKEKLLLNEEKEGNKLVNKESIINKEILKIRYNLIRKYRVYIKDMEYRESVLNDINLYLLRKKKNKMKNKYSKINAYLMKLEKGSMTPVDLKNLTLWNKKGLKKRSNKNKESDKSREKIFKNKKYSINQYKNMFYFERKLGKKKAIGSKKWKEKLESYYSYSKQLKNEKKNDKNIKELRKDYKKNNVSYFEYYKNENLQINRLKNNKTITNNNLNKNNNESNVSINNNVNSNKESLNYGNILNRREISKLRRKYIREIRVKNILDMLRKKYYNLNISKLNTRFFLGKNEEIINKNIDNKKKGINYKLSNTIYSNKKALKLNKLRYKLGWGIQENLKLNKYIDNVNKEIYTKNYWDELDSSLLSLLNRTLSLQKKNRFIVENNMTSLNGIFEKCRKYLLFNDWWYSLYYRNYIKKEFDKLTRLVLADNVWKLNNIGNKNSEYAFINENDNLFGTFYDNIERSRKNSNVENDPLNDYFNIFFLFTYYPNAFRHNLKNKLKYNEELFKPYYRYLIPIYIMTAYTNFINMIGFKNVLYNNKISKIFSRIKELSWIRDYNIIIYNFILVRTLFGLLSYNYRSLVRVKARYIYLNKLKYYQTKLTRLNMNTWLTTIKYIKRLRRTPKYFWQRYHKLISFYVGRLLQNSELDSKRKVLVPFIIHVEDIIYSIYGKWVIIKLWPLRSFVLSSFALVDRLVRLYSFKGKKVKDRSSPLRRLWLSTIKFRNYMKLLHIENIYKYYNKNNGWPLYLTNILNDKRARNIFSYKSLEYLDNNMDRWNNLNVTNINENNVLNNISILSFPYLMTNPFKDKEIFKSKKEFLDFNIPTLNSDLIDKFKSYIKDLDEGWDIDGLSVKVAGRLGVNSSHKRKYKRVKTIGSFKAPVVIGNKAKKPVSLTLHHLRGYKKSNVDSSRVVIKTLTGMLSFTVWISSNLSINIKDLLLYLLTIKYIYNQLLNRYFIVTK